MPNDRQLGVQTRMVEDVTIDGAFFNEI